MASERGSSCLLPTLSGRLGRAVLMTLLVALNLTVVIAVSQVSEHRPIAGALPASCPAGSAGAEFSWFGAAGGNQATWSSANGDGSSQIYTVSFTNAQGQPDTVDVTLTLSDPSGRNNQAGRPPLWPLSDNNPLLTQTNGGYGLGFLTVGMSSLNQAETVTFDFSFSKPVLMDNFRVGDVDWAGLDQAENFSVVEEPGNSFQDELSIAAAGPAGNVPISITGGANLTVFGQTVRSGNYVVNVNGDVGPTDPAGIITVASAGGQAITGLSLNYSNGPDDAAAEQTFPGRYVNRYGGAPTAPTDGASDDHGVAIPGFDFCVVDAGIDLQKTVYPGHDSGASCPGTDLAADLPLGADVTYCFAAQNVGAHYLTNLTLDDTDLGIDESDLTVISGTQPLSPPTAVGGNDGEVLSWYYETGAPAADLLNTATTTGQPSDPAGVVDPALGPVEDSDTAQVTVSSPAIDIQKTVYSGHDAGASCTGAESVSGTATQPVTYCFVVTNTGDNVLTNVTVDDLDLGIDESAMSVLGASTGTLSRLDPGETVELFVDDSITGDLTNTATAVGAPADAAGVAIAGASPVTDDDTASVDQIPPAISIEKTVYAGHNAGLSCAGFELVSGESGDAVTYCFVVTNTGGSVLTAVQVDDLDLGIDQTNMTVLSGALASLSPGASVELYYEATISADLVNTADTSATPPSGSDPTDSDTASVIELVPGVSIDKTVYLGQDLGVSCAGAELVTAVSGAGVTYCFSVTNTGETALDMALVDGDLGIDQDAMAVLSGSLTGLAPGATVSLYYETQIAGDLVNTATVTGTSPAGAQPTDDDTAEVDEVAPGISIDKTVYLGHDAGVSCQGSELVSDENGEDVTYCFVVTNTGDTTLDPVTVTDGDLGIDQDGMTVLGGGALGALAPAQSVTLYYETTINGDLLNRADVVGIPLDRNDVAVPGFAGGVTDDDTAAVDELVPGVSIAKTVYAGHDSGASCAGKELVTAVNGADVTYCFSVTNTSGTSLDIAVDDPDLVIDEADMKLLSGSLTALAPGATVVLYYETMIAGDLVNTALVTGTSPAGAQPTDSDSAEVDQVAPAISIDKTVYLGHDSGVSCVGTDLVTGENGIDVTYCFVVTNTGDTTLDPVTVDDADLAVDEADMTVLSGSLVSLSAGSSVSLYYETIIGGDLTNTAVAVGTPLDRNDVAVPGFPSGVTDSDQAAVDEIGPEIGVAKTVTAQPVGNGDGSYTLTYTIEVQNTGDLDLGQVKLTDDLQATFADAVSFTVDDVDSADLTVNWPGFDGIATGDPQLLAGTDGLTVGEKGTVMVTVTVVPGAELGPYVNTAIGSGLSPSSETVTDISDSGTDSDPTRSNPGEPGDSGGTDDPVPVGFPPLDLTIVKTADVQAVPAEGGIVRWDIVVTNLGPGDDSGPITVTDDLPDELTYVDVVGTSWDCSFGAPKVTCVWAGPLAAGQNTTPFTVTTQVDDSPEGSILNGATVTGTGVETSTENNSSADEVTTTGTSTNTATGQLPTTGATVAGLVILALGLIAGGRLLTVGRLLTAGRLHAGRHRLRRQN